MSRRELAIWIAATVLVTLAVAWLVERRHVLSFRAELEQWNREAAGEPGWVDGGHDQAP